MTVEEEEGGVAVRKEFPTVSLMKIFDWLFSCQPQWSFSKSHESVKEQF